MLAARTVLNRASARWSAVALVGLTLTLSESALAVTPTIEQCLQASDASLELETQNKLIATRDALRTCASASCPDEIRSECLRRIAIVEKSIPSIVCEIRDAKGAIRTDARLSVDGAQPVLLPNGTIELELGPHTLMAEAPGVPGVSQRVELRTADKNQLVKLALPQPVAPLHEPSPSAAAAMDTAPKSPLPTTRVIALATGGVGLASLAMAGVFTIVTLDRKSNARSICESDPCSSREGHERWQSAWRAGNVTTAFAIGSGAALATAAALWFSADDQSVSVAIGPTQLQLGARF